MPDESASMMVTSSSTGGRTCDRVIAGSSLALNVFSALCGAFKGVVRRQHPYADKMSLPRSAVSEITAPAGPAGVPARRRAQVPAVAR